MVKFVAFVVWMFVVFLSAGYGDTIVLRKDSTDVDLRITSVRKEYINAILSRNYIKSVNMEFSHENDYPDVIILNSTPVALECKIKEITVDFVRLQIPVSVISSLAVSSAAGGNREMTFSDKGDGHLQTGDAVGKDGVAASPGEGRDGSLLAGDGRGGGLRDWRSSSSGREMGEKNYRLRVKKPQGESAGVEDSLATPEAEFSEFAETVTDEFKQSTDTETYALNQPPVQETEETADKESREESEEGKRKEKPVDQDPNLGRVEGRILHSGKPLPNCQVKLQMLEKGGILAKGYRPIEGALEIETATNNEGVYQFMNVSPGLYKMYWKPPAETAWVRRFKMEPDVVVNSGRLTKPKDIETLKRTLN